ISASSFSTRRRTGSPLSARLVLCGLSGLWRRCRSAATIGRQMTSHGSGQRDWSLPSGSTATAERPVRPSFNGGERIMADTTLEKETGFPTAAAATLQLSALQAASPIVLALVECDDDLRAEAIELFKQLGGGELDPEQRFATTALLAEMLFANADHTGAPGLDLVEAEAMAPTVEPGAEVVLA